jgi:hypothetical protein
MGNRQSDCGFVERGGDKVARSRWARTMSACAARALRMRYAEGDRRRGHSPSCCMYADWLYWAKRCEFMSLFL